jgi:hypothetical protein
VTFYKFLGAGRIAPFSGHTWSDDWLETRNVVACERGVHACRITDLPFWLHDELWRVELAGPVTPVGQQVVAPRARLVGQVSGWNTESTDAFVLMCLFRTAAHAAAECAGLDDGSLMAAAEQLSASGTFVSAPTATVSALRELAVRRQEAAVLTDHRSAARVCGYLADAIDMARVYPVSAMGYVAARAAQSRRPDATGDRYAEERRWQAAWLAERLNLDG